jgi:HEXXH motif-containing protein
VRGAKLGARLEPPADLTLPLPGSATLRRILGLYLRRVLDDFLRVPLGRFRSQVFDGFADARALVERALREGRGGAVLAMMRRPTHSTLIRCLYAELYGAGDVDKLDGWLAELTALTLLELARAGELPESGIRAEHSPRRLLSIGGNFVLPLEPGARVGFLPGRLVIEQGTERREIDLATEPAAKPYLPIAGGLCLALADNNPLAAEEAHPEKSGNALDLGGRSPEEWTAALAGALALVDEQLPELGAEIRLVMQTLVPVGYDPERHLSASYAEAIGTAYLSLHPDRMTMAEALIHEFSHNKLNALAALEELVENAFSPLYRSPVRPDPRPLHGILLAVHAFVPVARLYERMLESGHPLAGSPGFERRLREIADGNHEGTSTLLAHAKPTGVGRGLLEELERWDEHFARWRQPSP